MRAELRQQFLQAVEAQRNAAGGRAEIVARDMHEHGAAATGDAGTRIVVQLDDVVVEAVGARQMIGGAAFGQADRAVVVPVGRILAPAV